MQSADVVIIGAGIIGLATAREIQRKNPDFKIVILEKEKQIAQHQTGHNSGVVHSGVYYQPGSLKAATCIRGREKLLSFCDEKGIPVERLSKVIVATDESELPFLQELERRGRLNGVEGLQMVGSQQLKEIEPHATGLRALLIPKCPIVCYPSIAKAIAEELQGNGVEILCGEKVLEIQEVKGRARVRVGEKEYEAKRVVNCAGLFSDRLSRSRSEARIIPFRGEYYELVPEKRGLVKGLIYPVANPRFPFLGVHLTRMIGGRVEAGPNAVMALAREGYRKNDINFRDMADIFSFQGFWKMALKYPATGLYEYYRSLSKAAFVRDLQKLVPEIQAKDLEPGMSGVRAQMVGKDGALIYDFLYKREGNLIHVLNTPSPAATASFAIAEKIYEQIEGL